MDDPIFEEYLVELHNINPTINDFFMREEWNDKNHIQPNIYSEVFYKKLNVIHKKYLKRLEQKKELSFYEEIFKKDLKSYIHFEEGYLIYYYMPISLRENILIDYVGDCSGEGGYRFDTKKDYKNFLKRLRSLNGIVDEAIKKMRYGIREKIVLYEKTVSKMIDNINDILKEKSYTHTKEIKISKKEWDDSVEKYLVSNLKKLNEFLIDEYLPKSSKKCGLHQYKGGKKGYKFISKLETLRELTPHSLFNLGMSEIERIEKEKKKLEKEIGKGDIDQYINGEKSDYYRDKKEIFKDINKIKDEIIKNTFSKYFHGK